MELKEEKNDLKYIKYGPKPKNASKVHELINKTVYDSSENIGRKGVLNLENSFKIIKRHVNEKQRLTAFAEKFGKRAGIDPRELRQQGGMKAMRDMMI